MLFVPAAGADEHALGAIDDDRRRMHDFAVARADDDGTRLRRVDVRLFDLLITFNGAAAAAAIPSACRAGPDDTERKGCTCSRHNETHYASLLWRG